MLTFVNTGYYGDITRSRIILSSIFVVLVCFSLLAPVIFGQNHVGLLVTLNFPTILRGNSKRRVISKKILQALYLFWYTRTGLFIGSLSLQDLSEYPYHSGVHRHSYKYV
jgi:hypothetical protein